MTAADTDVLLRRLQRNAIAFCAIAALAALWWRRGQFDVALGIAGGGALIAVSYWAIRSSIDGLVALAAGTAARTPPDGAEADAERARSWRRAMGYVARFAGRYLALGLLAYVMLVWLRLHPVGMIIGVSSMVAAAALLALSAARERR